MQPEQQQIAPRGRDRVVPSELFVIFYALSLAQDTWRPLYGECGHIRAFTSRATAEIAMKDAKELMGSTPLCVLPLEVKA